MGRSAKATSRKHRKAAPASLARALAPEEICRGDYVAPLYVISEWPSFFWCSDASLHPRDELVRLCSTPHGEFEPLRVRAVCLPFVLVKAPAGDERTVDVRTRRLARLERTFAQAAWRAGRKRAKRDAKAARRL